MDKIVSFFHILEPQHENSLVMFERRSRVAIVFVGVVRAVDGAVTELRQSDAPAVDAAQFSAGARRRVRTVLATDTLRLVLLVRYRDRTIL